MGVRMGVGVGVRDCGRGGGAGVLTVAPHRPTELARPFE